MMLMMLMKITIKFEVSWKGNYVCRGMCICYMTMAWAQHCISTNHLPACYAFILIDRQKQRPNITWMLECQWNANTLHAAIIRFVFSFISLALSWQYKVKLWLQVCHQAMYFSLHERERVFGFVKREDCNFPGQHHEIWNVLNSVRRPWITLTPNNSVTTLKFEIGVSEGRVAFRQSNKSYLRVAMMMMRTMAMTMSLMFLMRM